MNAPPPGVNIKSWIDRRPALEKCSRRPNSNYIRYCDVHPFSSYELIIFCSGIRKQKAVLFSIWTLDSTKTWLSKSTSYKIFSFRGGGGERVRVCVYKLYSVERNMARLLGNLLAPQVFGNWEPMGFELGRREKRAVGDRGRTIRTTSGRVCSSHVLEPLAVVKLPVEENHYGERGKRSIGAIRWTTNVENKWQRRIGKLSTQDDVHLLFIE